MEGPRSPKPDEIAQLLEFLDKELRPNAKWSINEEYPTAFQPGNFQNIRIVKDQDQVLSHAVVRPTLVKSPAGFFKVASIGSVVTDSGHRNQGLSKQVMEDCIEFAKNKGNDFAILWTDLYDFYRQFGFELSGSEISALIDREIKTDADKNYKIVEGKNIDPSAIYKLFAKHTVSTIRTIEEIRKYLSIPNSKVYTAWNEDGTIAAYAVEGKGADLNGYIHEWGGSVTPLLELLNHIRTAQNRNVTIIIPEHSVNLIQRLTQNGFLCHVGFLGMVKILNPKYLFPKIIRHAQIDLGVKDFVLKEDDGVFTFGIGKNTIQIDDEKEMCKILLGPYDPKTDSRFDIPNQDLLKNVLPLRMWIWGWDSV